MRLIEDMQACATQAVGISGGEPFMRKDLPELVEALVEGGISVSLNTNGVLVPRHEETMRRLSRVKISIDGPKEAHDAERGEGSWDAAVHAIDLCRVWSIPVTVQAVLTRSSLPHLDAFVEWCASRGLPYQVQPPNPFKLNTTDPVEDPPDAGEVRRALAKLASLPADRRPSNGEPGLRHMQHWPDPAPMECASGLVSARISADGHLSLCGQPPPGAPNPSWRELGLAEAFHRLHPVPCDQCWCAMRVDANLAYHERDLRSAARRLLRVLPRRPAGRHDPR
jgi:MoaA/NifB/PqqE/SkfB family radical SAM enzyme